MNLTFVYFSINCLTLALALSSDISQSSQLLTKTKQLKTFCGHLKTNQVRHASLTRQRSLYKTHQRHRSVSYATVSSK